LITLKIHHRTAYRYRQPVSLGLHRLMLRPRESRDLRIISSNVTVTPLGVVTWAHDVFGNAVATVTFQAMADSLVIDSVAELQLNAAAWPVFDIAASAIVYPFQYSGDEWIDLGAFTVQQYPDQASRLKGWARAFVRGTSTDTLSLLKDLSAGVSGSICYQSREEEGGKVRFRLPGLVDTGAGFVAKCRNEEYYATLRPAAFATPVDEDPRLKKRGPLGTPLTIRLYHALNDPNHLRRRPAFRCYRRLHSQRVG